jgi:hypothetical protein
MSDVSGIPNMGFGGGGYFGGSAALGLPAMSADQINASMGWNPNAAQLNPWANTPGGFGAQTAYYAGVGADYGRATGGFGGYGSPNADPFTAVPGEAEWQTNQRMKGYPSGDVQYGGPMPNIPYQDPFGGGGWSGGGAGPSTYSSPGLGGGGFNSGSAYDWNQMFSPQPVAQANPWADGLSNNSNWTYLPDGTPVGGGGGFGGAAASGMPEWQYNQMMKSGGGGSINPYAGMILGPMGNPSYFNPGTYAGDQGNYGLPYNGSPQPGDIGFSRQSQMPNLGYNPGMANWFANPGMSGGAFQERFGMGFPNAGTPSQYAPGAQMPAGFSPLYSIDNPNGALPVNWGGNVGGAGG